MNIKQSSSNREQKILWCGVALLLAILAVQAVLLWTGLAATPVQSIVVDKRALPEYDMNVLLTAELFGGDTFAAQQPRQQLQANQNFKLQGLFSSEDDSLASAIVAGDGIETANYKVGDELRDGIEVVKIEPRRVVISNRGERQFIEFPVATATDQATDTPTALAAETTAETQAESLNDVPEQERMDAVRSRLAQLRDDSRANP